MKTAIIGTLLLAGLAFGQDEKRARVDVENYTIEAQVNPATQTLAARVVMRFVAQEDAINAVTFELNNNLNISKIADDKGNAITGTRNPQDNTVRLAFATPLQKDQAVTVTFTYDGRLTGTEESPIYGIKFAAIQPDHAFLLYPSRWFPVNNYSSDRFSSKISITVPDGFTAIGSGIGSKVGQVFTFESNKPSFPGSIAVAKDAPVRNSTDGITTMLYFRAAEVAQANAYGAATAQMVNHFTGVFGLAPYANLTIVETEDGAPNGYSAPGLIFLNPRAISKEVNSNVLVNQIARQWWETQVSPVNRNHIWLENGMALYSEALWTEKEKGASALEQRMRDAGITALTIENVPLIQASRLEDYSPEYWATTAAKGAAVYQMLRNVLGEDNFKKLLKAIPEQFANKSVSTDDISKMASDLAGYDLGFFFLQWIESSGAPQFKLEYTVYRTNKGFRIMGKIQQDLDTFRMPVDLKIETEGNPEFKRVEVAGPSSEFIVETFGKPKKVEIDPNLRVLRMSPTMRVAVAIRRGEMFTDIGEYGEALKEFQKALEVSRNSSLAHYRVADIFFLQNNYQAAANEFREVLNGDIEPKWTEVWSHINLGKIFDMTGQRDRAVNEYNLAVRTRDDTQGAQEEAAKYLKDPYKRQRTGSN